ncbi:hypothetical protein [Streptomyces sp.]|uniref:hypothetical protein n=1 Tax=Streptomyces sp. TaxID=1931 RepID=UPI002F3ED7C5
MSEPTLAVHELSFVAEGDDVVVGRLDTGSYAVFPADGAELLKRLADGLPLREAAEWYESTFSEPVDVDDFVSTLRELGFVRENADDAPGGEQPAGPAQPPRFKGLGRAVFSPLAWAAYAGVVVAWLVVLARHSDLVPTASQFFFVKSLVIVQVVITFGQIPLILLHEGFHILAGRRLGLPSRLRLSNRLTYIVAETQINGLMSVERRKRYLPFLSGMVCDLVVLGVLGLIAQAARNSDGGFSLTSKVCLAFGFTVTLRFLWQFQLYLRTDLFYVVATALKTYDLHDASKAILKNRIWRLLRLRHRIVDEEQWTERDRKVGVYYGPFLILGVCTFIALTVFASIPVSVRYFTIAAEAIGSGDIDAHFWDSVVSLCFNVAQVVTLVILSRGKRKERSRFVPRLSGSEG